MDEVEQRARLQERHVRHTIIRVITAHLREGAPVSWQGCDLDFSGAVFDGGDFSGAVFSSGQVDFSDAVFSGGQVDLYYARLVSTPPIFDSWTDGPPDGLRLPRDWPLIDNVGLVRNAVSH